MYIIEWLSNKYLILNEIFIISLNERLARSDTKLMIDAIVTLIQSELKNIFINNFWHKIATRQSNFSW